MLNIEADWMGEIDCDVVTTVAKFRRFLYKILNDDLRWENEAIDSVCCSINFHSVRVSKSATVFLVGFFLSISARNELEFGYFQHAKISTK